jgi:hypothetical protein
LCNKKRIYDTTPPALNLKCIVFTLMLSAGYWFLPSKNKFVLLSLSYFPYLILAWYDYLYKCQHNFGPTYLANFYAWAKPQSSSQIKIYKNWDPRIKFRVLAVDLCVLGLLIYLGTKFFSWTPKQDDPNSSTSKLVGYIFLGLVIVSLLYLRFTVQ